MTVDELDGIEKVDGVEDRAQIVASAVRGSCPVEVYHG